MKLKELDISKYIEEIPDNDYFIKNFIGILQYLTSNQGANKDSDTKYERNVMLNLLFRYGFSLSETKLKLNEGKDFIIGGDMRKYLNVSRLLDADIINTYNRIPLKRKKKLAFNNDDCADITFSPDIVIHTSNDSSSTQKEYQHLVLEAKTTNSLCKTAFFWDLFKLNVYKEKLKFRHLIYYIYGSEKDKIEDFLKNYTDHNYYRKHSQDILFVIQNKLSEDVRLYKIEE